jgi:hypothetical protein
MEDYPKTFSTNENKGAVDNEAAVVSQPSRLLSCLGSFTMLCTKPFSPFIDKLLSIISTTSKDRIRVIQVSGSSVISRVAGHIHGDYSIFRYLKVLRVQLDAVPREAGIAELDFLPHMAYVGVLELTSMHFPDRPLDSPFRLSKSSGNCS